MKKTRAWAQRYAEKNGWVLNPNSEELATTLRGLVTNRARFGRLYCPCRLRSGDPKEDKKIICPGISHQDEIEKEGHCHCRLFFRADADGKEGTL
jgi:ferredoxin-thioredoxin reductase catalytic subunit